MNEASNNQYILQSVSNALSVLDLLGQYEALTVAEVSSKMHLGKATAFRLLTTLEHHGYISKDASAHYRLGMKFAMMGNIVQRRSELARLAHPYLEELRAEFQETAHLVGWNNASSTVVLDRVIGASPISYYTNVGYVTDPAHIAASGQVLLAFAEEPRLEEYFHSVDWARCAPLTDPAIPDEAALRRLLDQARQNGYASNFGDAIAGLYCFAVPVLGISGHAIASLSISGPGISMQSQQQAMVERLRQIADQLHEQFCIGLDK